jgi:hypothetical protein
MVHIAPRPGEKIVDTQHLITAVEQPLTEVRANESSSARNGCGRFGEQDTARARGQSILAVSLTHFRFIYALNK